ncbi:MAG: hypothetical protein AAGI88_04140 [Pseudomonadota bacterium]
MKNTICRRRVVLLSLILSCVSMWCQAQEKPQASRINSGDTVARVAAVTPIGHSLSARLLDGTGIETDFLPPERLPMNRIESWLRKNRSRKFDRYDALISISDAVPAFSFSTTLRQTNIRLVTIDIAYARLPQGERVVLSNSRDYFWLNSNNLLLMLGILKRDLGLLWPEHRERINQNYQRASAEVRKYNLDVDNLLFDNDIAVLVFDKPGLKPLAGSLSMDVMTQVEAKTLAMPTLRIGGGPTRKDQSSSTATPAELLHWQIDDLSRFSEKPLEARLQNNLLALQQVFE